MRPALKNLTGKKDLIGAEIGVKRAVNAKDILDNLSIKELYLIDSFENKEWLSQAKKLLSPYNDKVTWIIAKSSDAITYIEDKELDFIYIDGDHRYEGVKSDIKNYYPKVKVGGLIGGHDYDKRQGFGIIQAVDEYFGKGYVNSAICDIPTTYNITDWWTWRKND